MLGRNGNIAYVRYDSHGRIVPGGPIISAQRPKVGFWQPVSNAIGTSVTSNSLRAFVRIDAYGRVVPSSLLLLAGAPSAADSGTSWLEINATYIPYVPTTTTTTTTSTSSTTTTSTTNSPSTTTTTTTADPYYYYLSNQYFCPDCSTIIGTNTIVKSLTPIPNNYWVLLNYNSIFQITAPDVPYYMATLVDGTLASPTCNCPTTTSTTTSTSSTTTTTTAIPSTTTTTTTSAVLDCALGAVVNPTFVGGPVGVTIVQSCTGGNPPFLILTDYTGGSGSYTILTYESAVLLQYPEASYATTPILPTPINDGYTLSKLFKPGWPPGTTFWLVFADFYNHSNQILVTIVIEACPTPPPSNTVFMKFDIL